MERLNSKKSYSEVFAILNILGNEFIDKIPNELYEFIKNERDIEYEPDILTTEGILDEKKISKEAIAIFAVLNLKYIVSNEKDKKEMLNIFHENEIKYQLELQKKYDSNNIFSKDEIDTEVKKDNNIENGENSLLLNCKETIWKKFLNKIKNIFNRVKK